MTEEVIARHVIDPDATPEEAAAAAYAAGYEAGVQAERARAVRGIVGMRVSRHTTIVRDQADRIAGIVHERSAVVPE